MPRLERNSKTYFVQTGTTGADPSVPPVPTNPARIGLIIQNTGANPGVLRFGGPPQGAGKDLAFSAGQREPWLQSDTTPLEAIYFLSAAATTWCVVEIVRELGPGARP